MIKNLKKIIFIIFITGLLFLFFAKKVYSKNIIIDSSAKIINDLKTINTENQFFYYKIKELAIKNIFEYYRSPLAGEEKNFILACRKYKIDCFLLPAIAGVESTFGKNIVYNSYNPFGWGGGYIFFKNWNEAIDSVAASIKKKYIDQWGLKTVEEIAIFYSESPDWPKKVNWFIEEFKKEEEKLLLLYKKINVEL